jgi:hypothetical protein
MLELGRRGDALLVMMALGVVRDVRNQFKGLFVRGGLEELSTAGEGRVRFDSTADVYRWLDTLAEIAPTKLREFADQRGDELLMETAVARDAALRAFSEVVLPALNAGGLEAVAALPRPEQQDVIRRLYERPFILGADELRAEYEGAVTGLVLVGDRDVMELGAVVFTWSDDPVERIRQMVATPLSVSQRVRLLADLIVHYRSRN